MLCLTRKTNERLILKHPLLPSDITFVVLGVRGDKVTIGVDAPKEVTVHREEVYEAIQRDNAEPAEAAKPPDAIEGMSALIL